MNPAPTFEPLGDDAVLIRFGVGIDAAVNARVHAAATRIANAAYSGIRDLVPGYATLGIHYDWEFWSGDQRAFAYARIVDALNGVLELDGIATDATPRTVEIPVCYDGTDLADVARHAGLAESEVIARHTGAEYTVAMLGFAPGFPYLLGLDPAIATPRRATPRTRVPAGSVAIGGAQTAVYPSELPGGWNLIGRTPLALFDVARSPPNLVAPGDRVRFRAVARDDA
jgi:KipI family sensor histidine kinase inhibitor